MKLTYFGHSACLLEVGKYKLLFDPFLKDNPLCDVDPKEVKCDYILLTHGHMDHVGDAVDIALRNDAVVLANFELAAWLEKQGLPKVHPLHIGGGADFPFGRAQMTIAFHGSSIPGADGLPVYMGMPGGFLITSGEQTFYHAGDTALTLEFELLARRHKIDLAMLPIGDNFTMGIDDALAALTMLKPRHVVPIHYNTFPYIEVDPQRFAEGARQKDVEPHILSCGDVIEV